MGGGPAKRHEPLAPLAHQGESHPKSGFSQNCAAILGAACDPRLTRCPSTPRSVNTWHALSKGQAVCQLASHFFRQTLLYLTFEVVDPLWRVLETRLLSAHALDDVIAEHAAFLRRLLKGCLLSRKVVVLRALLALKDLALQFVRVSDKFLDISATITTEEEEYPSRRPSIEHMSHAARVERARRRQDALASALASPEYDAAVSELRSKFTEKTREFMAQLSEARRSAALDGIEPKEELDSLDNLILRLDLYGFFHAHEHSMTATSHVP